MSEKDSNVSAAKHGSAAAEISKAVHNVKECLCGCGEIVYGTTGSAFVVGHDSELVWRIVAEDYGNVEKLAATYSKGLAANAHWRLNHWHPETAIGQWAKGRVYKVLPLHFHGLVKLDTFSSYDHGEEAKILSRTIKEAGARLDAEFGDPFASARIEHFLLTAGPVWQTAQRKLLTFDKKRRAPSISDKNALLEYEAARSNLVQALELAPDAPSELVVPGEAAFSVLQDGLPEQAEKMLLDATEMNVLDVDSWVLLAAEAFRADRLDDAFGYSEATLAVMERSLPGGFSGTLRSSWFDNMSYLLGRRILMFVLWKLNRFDDAYRVAVDTVWLDPQDDQNIRRYLGHIKSRMPFSDAFFPGDSPI